MYGALASPTCAQQIIGAEKKWRREFAGEKTGVSTVHPFFPYPYRVYIRPSYLISISMGFSVDSGHPFLKS